MYGVLGVGIDGWMDRCMNGWMFPLSVTSPRISYCLTFKSNKLVS